MRYEIEPPAAMAAEYRSMKEVLAGRRAQERSKHVDHVVNIYEERKSQKEQLITLRLKDRSETVFVGEFEVK